MNLSPFISSRFIHRIFSPLQKNTFSVPPWCHHSSMDSKVPFIPAFGALTSCGAKVQPTNRGPNRCHITAPKPHQKGVSKNNGTPKSSILIGFSIINHPFLEISILLSINGSTQKKHPQQFFVHVEKQWTTPLPRVCTRKKRKLHLGEVWKTLKFSHRSTMFSFPLCSASSSKSPARTWHGCQLLY